MIAAHLADLSGDVQGAADLLDAIRPSGSRARLTWTPYEALGFERLRVAELMMSQGRFPDAMRVASEFDHPAPMLYLMYLPQSLAIRMRAADALGRRDLATAYRARLEEIGRAELVNNRQSP